LGYALAKQGGGGDAGLLLALLGKNRQLALKRVMAEQFEDLRTQAQVFDGPKGSTLISGRNKAALEVLRQQIAAGKRKLAIFYGAAHMPDMEKRLRQDFGLVPSSVRRLVAWDLGKPRS
jgi:hypothetical protein